MKKRLAAFLIFLCGTLAACPAWAQSTTGNLLTNPGAELGTGTDPGLVTGWTPGGDSNPGRDNGSFNPGQNPGLVPHSGSYDFYGNTGTMGTLTQRVDLFGVGITPAVLDSGSAMANVSFYELSLYTGGSGDNAGVNLSFIDAAGMSLGTATSGQYDSEQGYALATATAAIPVGTRYIDYQLSFDHLRFGGAFSPINAFVDDTTLTVSGVPEPSTLVFGVLSGVALLALGIRNRRDVRNRPAGAHGTASPYLNGRASPGCVLALAALGCVIPSAYAQVTTYTDEASFNAATVQLQFVPTTFEGIAPAGGQVVVPSLAPLVVVNQDRFLNSTSSYEVDDSTYDHGNLSLNGSATLIATDDSVNFPYTVTLTFTAGPVTAFSTDLGFLNGNGGDRVYGGYGDVHTYHYPVTGETFDVQLYNTRKGVLVDGVYYPGTVGGVYHAGTVANGFVGCISTELFDAVIITHNHQEPDPLIYDSTGYEILDPYFAAFDNVRFGAAPLMPQYLYVSDLAAGEIYGYSNAGALSGFTNKLTGPTCLAFDSAGNLYEADTSTGTIYKSSLTGSPTVFASGFTQIYGLAFDASGNLFAATLDANNGGSIIKLTPAGVQSTFATGLTRVRGLAFDATGNLYESELDTGSVYKFTPAGTRSTFATGFNYPTGLAFDATGNLFVCSQGVGVFKVTPAGVVSTFTTNVTDPRYLAFDATGNLFVTDVGDASGDPGQGSVYQFAPDGTRTTFASNLAFPAGIVVTPTTTAAAPIITSALAASGQFGSAFSYQIAASNTPTGFGATGLPHGLSVNAATGLITGSPMESGVFPVTLSATNVSGTAMAVLILTVNPSLLPMITVAATTTVAHLGAGTPGVFTMSLSTAQATKTMVRYTLKGSGVNGMDYVHLNGKAKIKPGKTSTTVQVVPIGDLARSGNKAVKLVLTPESTYTVGAMTQAKVKIKP